MGLHERLMSRQSHHQFIESISDLSAPPIEQAATSRMAKRRFEAPFHHAPVGIAHVGMDGHFLLVNPRFCEICGYDAETLMRTGFRQITHPDDLDGDNALLARLHAREIARYVLEKRYIRADGTSIWVNLTVAMVSDERGEPEFYLAVIEDLSALRRASFEALHDPLTGLLNRRGLISRASGLMAEAERVGEMVGLLFLDLDGFKQLNDGHGHAAGDACLVAVSQLLRSSTDARDVVARIGGDEFLVVTGVPGAEQARLLGERLRHALALTSDGVTGSFGLAIAQPGAGMDLDQLIARADGAMLAAKRAGKNRLAIG